MILLTDEDVRTATPPLGEVVDRAEEALVTLADGRAEAPPKPTVHPSPGVFANAMPAALPERGLLGCKWVALAPANPLQGLPTANGLMVIADGETGIPQVLMPAGELTALRTAAVSAACIRALAPDAPVTILGAGVQARSHLRLLDAIGVPEVHVWARRGDAIEELLRWAEGRIVVPVVARPSREAALRDAPVVVTALSIGLTETRIPDAWVAEDALLLPLDYASSVGPRLAETGLLAADDVTQLHAVSQGWDPPYPRATTHTGHLIRSPRPTGRVVLQNLGTGVADLLVADAIAQRAAHTGTGTEVTL